MAKLSRIFIQVLLIFLIFLFKGVAMSQSKLPDINVNVVSQITPIVNEWCTLFKWSENETKSLLRSLESSINEEFIDTDGIFTQIHLPPGVNAKFPIDFYIKEDYYEAFIIPKKGALPSISSDNDNVYVPTYKIANYISIDTDYLQDRRKDVIRRSLNVFLKGFAKIIRRDKMRILMFGAYKNNPVPLSNLNKLVQDFALRGRTLTHIVVSRRAMEIMSKESQAGSLARYPKLSEINDSTIPVLTGLNETYGIKILVEDGLSDYYYNTLLSPKRLKWYQKIWQYIIKKFGYIKEDKEIILGLDLSKKTDFVQPVRHNLHISNDPHLLKQSKVGIYGYFEHGVGVLNKEGLGLAYLPFER